jgi:hypothetical protein
MGGLDRAMDSRHPRPNDGQTHQEKAKQLLDLIWGNEDMLALFLRTESYAEMVTGSAENTRFFGTYG